MENHDYLFIALHGEDGESGDLQKILSDKSIPYSGSDAIACSRTWNKARCKEILNLNNISTPQWISIGELSQESCNLESDKFKRDGSSLRGSIMIVGPLLTRFGKGYIPRP
jgi:D-alanine-D-alanine ligase-like ATP-grasp enzyme